ncbi:MAG: hypothetical protein OK439_06150 [Thaumarchaeota archaeon]|nr:hypothetical protein [Nitrososphaerota archaeon]
MTSREKDYVVCVILLCLISLGWAGIAVYNFSVIQKQRLLIQKMYHDCPASPSNPKEIK